MVFRKRLKTKEWYDLRQKVLERDNFTCRDCGKKIVWGDLDLAPSMHHVHPFSKGGKDTLDNLITLHIICHKNYEKELRNQLGLYKEKMKIIRQEIKYERQEMKEEWLRQLELVSLANFKLICNWMDLMIKNYGYGRVA